MTTSIYDMRVERRDNTGQPPDWFPEASLKFKEFNDSMRELFAKLAQHMADNALIATTSSAPDGFGSDIQVNLNQSVSEPAPVGFLLGFELLAGIPNIPYLSIDGSNYRPIIYANGTRPGPNALKSGGVYWCVFTGEAWQLLSRTPGARVARTLRTETASAANSTLRTTDVGNTVVITAGANKAIVFIITDDLLSRWPVGSDVEILNTSYSGVSLSVPGSFTVPNGTVLPDTTINVPVGTVASQFTHFKLIRSAENEIRAEIAPRFVR